MDRTLPLTTVQRAAELGPTLAQTELNAIIERLERIAVALERGPQVQDETPFPDDAITYRWESQAQARASNGRLLPIAEPGLIGFDALRNVERQRALIERNTRQFVGGLPANNVLLTGARGTGKSSLVKACLHAFHADGLRLIEVEKEHLNDLPYILSLTRERPERFIVFCDDLSFEEGETGYKGLKTALDGSVAAPSVNTLVYATSNRRHLLPEHESDNRSYQRGDDGELHPGDVVEEKISLSERFGLWISFYSFSQDEYLVAVDHWLDALGLQAAGREDAHREALQWALYRGSRSGRIAWQFARDYLGRQRLGEGA